MKINSVLSSSLFLMAFGFIPGTTHAGLYSSSLGDLVPTYVANDDESYGSFNLGFSIDFFGASYSDFYINNNGNITFGAPVDAWTPQPLNSQDTQPMIAPYWTDLDSRNSPDTTAGIYLSQSTHQTVITWNKLGYFDQNYSGTATFQLVINDPSTAVAGQVFGFFYDNLSAGTDDHNVTAGFGDGLLAVNLGELSVAEGISAIVSAQLNQTRHWFDLSNGTPVTTVPLPSAAWLFNGVLLGFLGLRRRATMRGCAHE